MKDAYAEAAPAPGWKASLALGFRHMGERTVLAQRSGYGPLQVQRPFYPEGGVCHVYLLHPPGGIVGGDELEVTVDLGADARVLLTTPAAGKFYRSDGRRAGQSYRFSIASGAALEWFPQETIAFNGAIVRAATRIDLAMGAGFIGWEITCLGRPAAGEVFAHGLFEQRMELYRQGRPLLLERNRFDGGGAVLNAAWGLGGRPVTGTLICAGCDEADLAVARDALDADACAGVTLVDEVLVARYIGPQAEQAREQLVRIWQALRPRRFGLPMCMPRIWST